MLRIAIVTNELPPYRLPLFQALGHAPGVTLQVLCCTRREPNRQWELPQLEFDHVFLKERIFSVGGRYIHNNPGVFAALHRFRPDVVVTGGFNPTHLYAFAYARQRGLPHVPMTDGTDVSERGLSSVHRWVRRLVYNRSQAFVAASVGGLRLYDSYGVASSSCFRAPLCIDNSDFAPHPWNGNKRDVDLLFCGRLEAAKGPLFALDVAASAARIIGRKLSIAFVGSGAQELALRTEAERKSALIDASFHGFLSRDELPKLYRSARLFLFPTHWDAWGVVANEACASGVPVLVSPNAGCAGELVVDGWNGFVCELDQQLWAQRASMLLEQTSAWQIFSQNSVDAARQYTYPIAVSGLLAACRHAAGHVPEAVKVPDGYVD